MARKVDPAYHDSPHVLLLSKSGVLSPRQCQFPTNLDTPKLWHRNNTLNTSGQEPEVTSHIHTQVAKQGRHILQPIITCTQTASCDFPSTSIHSSTLNSYSFARYRKAMVVPVKRVDTDGRFCQKIRAAAQHYWHAEREERERETETETLDSRSRA